MRKSNLSSQIGTWTEMDGARDIFWKKSKNGTLIAPQMKLFGPKKLKFHARNKKCQFGNFSDRAGMAMHYQCGHHARIPHSISKILFALGTDEFLAMLEGKIREAPFF